MAMAKYLPSISTTLSRYRAIVTQSNKTLNTYIMAKILGYFLTAFTVSLQMDATLLGQLDDHNDQDDHENEMVPQSICTLTRRFRCSSGYFCRGLLDAWLEQPPTSSQKPSPSTLFVAVGSP